MYFFILLYTFSIKSFSYYLDIPKDEDVLNYMSEEHSLSELDPKEIDVLVWNIFKGKEENWNEEFDKLSKGKELLILQESVNSVDLRTLFKRKKTHESIMATAWYNEKEKGSETGVLTSSKAVSIKTNWQRSYYFEPVILTPKMTLFTEYRLKGKKETLLVGNIHGINFVRPFKLRHMIKEAKETIEKHSGPVIFAGDFNTWSKEKMSIMTSLLHSVGLKLIKFKQDNRIRVFGNAIDHIWYRKLKVKSKASYGPKGSDHGALSVSFSAL